MDDHGDAGEEVAQAAIYRGDCNSVRYLSGISRHIRSPFALLNHE